MRREELKERLQQIGANASEKTLRRWGETHIIGDHLPYSGTFRPGRGRGNAEDWPEESFLQAAGVVAMQQVSATRLTVPELRSLRITGDAIHKRGLCKPIYPDLTKLIEMTSPLQSLRLRQDAVGLYMPKDFVTLAFGVNDKDPRLHELYATYICAKEKARHRLADEHAEPWLITEPARVHLYYIQGRTSVIFRPSENPDPYFYVTFSHSRLEESKNGKDDPIFYFDGRDVRAVPESINIHIGD
jgi:hypothetical protein